MRLIATTTLLAIATFFEGTTAFPTGAGGCTPGMAAVSGSHLEAATVETGSHQDYNMELLINGSPLRSGTPMDVPIGVDHTWELRSTGISGFRGYLLRLDGGSADIDTTGSLSPISGQGGQVQVADSVCSGVGSATHRSRALKSSVSGNLRLEDLSNNLNFDVTVVFQNANGLSQYSYSPFRLTAVEATEEEVVDEEVVVEETPEPTPSPTRGTTAPPTPNPTRPVSDGDDDDDDDDDEDTTQQTTSTNTVSPTKKPTKQPASMPVPAPNPAMIVDGGDDNDGVDGEDYMWQPTTDPTMASSSTSTRLPRLTLVRPSCNENNTCTVCQGDCDMDIDCEGNLACFQRDDYDSSEVPGCAGKGVSMNVDSYTMLVM